VIARDLAVAQHGAPPTSRLGRAMPTISDAHRHGQSWPWVATSSGIAKCRIVAASRRAADRSRCRP
jgi:hypothetical protein